jgi:hypothetical protein
MKKGFGWDIPFRKIHDLFPYLYFALIALYFFAKHFTLPIAGNIWWWWGSALLMLLIAGIFLFQMRYYTYQLNTWLGLFTIAYSIYMGLAAYSDYIKFVPGELTFNWTFYVSIIMLFNFYSAINIINRKPNDDRKFQNGQQDWIALGIISMVVIGWIGTLEF